PAEQALRKVPKGVARLHVSAYQSWLFNRLTADRIPDLGTLLEGDLAFLHDRGAVFLVEDPAAEQPRADALEISPSAPLFGKKVVLAEDEPGRRERALLEEEKLDPEDFRLPGMRFNGERRPLRVPIEEPRVRPEGDDAILVSFSLPRGSYATTVLREVMKEDDPGLPESE
ncbi:MAG: tRNA pseudouridine(13) synthase TruD, partial [Planctomycetota bacterium]